MFRNTFFSFIVALLCTISANMVKAQTIAIEADKPVALDMGGNSAMSMQLFRHLWPKVTNAPIVNENAKLTIHLGESAVSKPFQKAGIQQEGFVIAFPDAQNIVIWAPSEKGVVNGVSEFFRRYAGVRWLFPGKEGLHAVLQKKIEIPMQTVSEEPKFVSRFFSWPYPHAKRNDPDFLLWQRFNRLSRAIEFHHNLMRLFDPKKYFATHRHFFPEKMKIDDSYTKWNPKLNAEGLTEEAIRVIKEKFRKEPNTSSYSLGMNDYTHFEDYKPSGKNSMGYPDCSDYYYSWVNKVIAGVSKEFPDKMYGMLAYVSITDPPTFPLDKRAVPFICVERLNWYDAKCAERDQQRTRDWSKKAQQLGWYDYAYGSQFYYIPRIYNHLFADYIRFAAKNNVIAYYAEVYGTELPTEGPKTTLMAQLLWNPDMDVDAFLDEWYNLAVGEKAAPFLKQYFDFWEEYMKKSGPASNWFQSSKKSTYLDFDNKTYLNGLTTEDLDRCEQILSQMRANCKDATAAQKKRGEVFYNCFHDFIRPRIDFALATLRPRKLMREKLIATENFNKPGKEKNKPAPDWLFWQRFPGESKAVHEANGGADGSGAVSFDLAAGKNALTMLVHNIEPEKGAFYRMTCKVRAQDTGTEGEVFVQIDYQTDQNNETSFGRFYSLRQCMTKEQRNGEWQTLDLVFTTPACQWKKASVSVGTQKVSKGKITVDSVEIYQERNYKEKSLLTDRFDKPPVNNNFGDWRFWQRNPGKAVISFDQNAGIANSGCIKIDLTNAATSTLVTRSVRMKGAGNYIFRCNFKAQQLAGKKTQLFVQVGKGKGKEKVRFKSAAASRGSDWQTLEVSFDLKEGEPLLITLEAGIENGTAGLLWIDNAEILQKQ